MPEGIGGRGENQARRTTAYVSSEATRLVPGDGGSCRGLGWGLVGHLGGRVRVDLRAERLQGRPEGLDLGLELAKLTTVPCPQGLDLPVELLDEDIGPHQEVFHQPAGDIGTPGQQLAFQFFQLEGPVSVVHLVGDRAEISAEGPPAPVGVYRSGGDDLLGRPS